MGLTGDEFSAAVTEYSRVMYRAARAILNSDADAQDAVGQAILLAWQSRHKLRDVSAVRPWLVKITVNCARRQWKKQWKTLSMDSLEQAPAPSREHVYRDLWEAVLSLPPESRAVVVLFYYEDCTVKQISKLLDIPEGTVKSRLKEMSPADEILFASYTYTVEDEVIPIPVENVSEKLLATAAEIRNPVGGGGTNYTPERYADAAELMGISLIPAETFDGWVEQSAGTIHLDWQDGVLQTLWLMNVKWNTQRDGSEVTLSLGVMACTDRYTGTDDFFIGFGESTAEQLTYEQYVTQAGLSVALVAWEQPGWSTSYHAQFNLGGVRYSLSTGCKDDQLLARQALLDVLESLDPSAG